jgi:DNA modification methylase
VWTNGVATLHQGDVLDVLGKLPERSVQCAVTSPPFWGLRNYGVDGQLGLEPTPDCLGWATKQPCGDCYVCHMVAVFRGVRRVLRDDGVCFLNLGDSYAGSGKGQNGDGEHAAKHGEKQHTSGGTLTGGLPVQYPGLKPKDLVGIPWRVALALQSDGWWLRSDVIWSKPNPMPESVQDRPTKSHEYIFVLTKSERYYWDIEAVRENLDSRVPGMYDPGNNREKRDLQIKHDQKRGSGGHFDGHQWTMHEGGRNIRTVWNIATQPPGERHFAAFPEKLVERCILAATPERGSCSECGKPWVRVVETEREPSIGRGGQKWTAETGQRDNKGGLPKSITHTTGWRADCDHTDTTPATVLDCFSGSGTTLLVAQKLGRKSIGIDLNQKYIDMAVKRLSEVAIPMNLSAAAKE